MSGAVRIIAGFNRPPSFSTSNDVVLNDAFNVLGEVVEAIDQVEQFNRQGESSHGAVKQRKNS
ncbi:hypothetical protein [Nostoc favosum]|uniref:Uncharacterized protein n=1 Tax=Nostoc favosum CHAB5714 TaxID=2780399 RepID=A0ABS8IFL9_9NOSO|nr:hypothetical protein [Nostoc favosum]MCC5602257.1 hypothetical protein [Nostoc favosum CHAB5714]